MQKYAKICLSAYVFFLAGLSGCAPEGFSTRTDTNYGNRLFSARCAACHGSDANGAGPASVELGMQPPSLRRLSISNNGVFPRDYVMSKIDGFKQNGHSGVIMPEFGRGDLGPLIQIEKDGLSTPTPANLVALANYIESLQE